MNTNFKNIVNFLFEVNNLKRFEHCGTKFAGVKNPDSIAEHVFRAMQLAYIIANLEGVDDATLLQILTIVLFHDNGEVRVNDMHKIASHYIDGNEAEARAFEDQIKWLPEMLQKRISGLVTKYNNRDTSQAYIIAKDADLLETALQAKEYSELGYKCDQWIVNAEACLQTESAKKICKEAKTTSFIDWWEELNKN